MRERDCFFVVAFAVERKSSTADRKEGNGLFVCCAPLTLSSVRFALSLRFTLSLSGPKRKRKKKIAQVWLAKNLFEGATHKPLDNKHFSRTDMRYSSRDKVSLSLFAFGLSLLWPAVGHNSQVFRAQTNPRAHCS